MSMVSQTSNNSYKTIVVDIGNYNKLKELGRAADSFNDVIGELLSNNSNNEQQKKEIEN
jgi:predicted CopG family antitoxin